MAVDNVSHSGVPYGDGNRQTSRTDRALQSTSPSGWFWVLWTFIGGVSALDAWLVIVNLDAIQYCEENFICRMLIALDPVQLSYFLPAKAAGTLAVLTVLRVMYTRLQRYGLVITSGVATYQLGLLMYFLL